MRNQSDDNVECVNRDSVLFIVCRFTFIGRSRRRQTSFQLLLFNEMCVVLFGYGSKYHFKYIEKANKCTKLLTITYNIYVISILNVDAEVYELFR